MSNAWEYVVTEEVMLNGYDANGDCIGQPEFPPPTPKRIGWDLKDPLCIAAIEEANSEAQILINDIHLRIHVHDHYGKGFMKKCRMSPDAFIQMALQLAYYRDAGRFSLTYEASMTRLFREGRTETVRPCSIESAEWVKSMLDANATVNILSQLHCINSNITFFQPIPVSNPRMRSALNYCEPHASDTRELIKMQCAAKESTGICFVYMLSQSIWKLILRS